MGQHRSNSSQLWPKFYRIRSHSPPNLVKSRPNLAWTSPGLRVLPRDHAGSRPRIQVRGWRFLASGPILTTPFSTSPLAILHGRKTRYVFEDLGPAPEGHSDLDSGIPHITLGATITNVCPSPTRQRHSRHQNAPSCSAIVAQIWPLSSLAQLWPICFDTRERLVDFGCRCVRIGQIMHMKHYSSNFGCCSGRLSRDRRRGGYFVESCLRRISSPPPPPFLVSDVRPKLTYRTLTLSLQSYPQGIHLWSSTNICFAGITRRGASRSGTSGPDRLRTRNSHRSETCELPSTCADI